MECFSGKHEGHEGPQRHTKSTTQGNRRLRRTQRPQRRQRGTETGGVLAHAGRSIGSLEVWRLGSLDRPNAARLLQRTRRITKVHKEHDAGGGPVGAWRASHAMLWGRGADAPTARLRRCRRFRRYRSAPAGRRQSRCAKRRQPPSYRSYTSYWSYRVVLWHVADVPGVQGRVEV